MNSTVYKEEEKLGKKVYDHYLALRMLGYLKPLLPEVILATFFLLLFALTQLAGPIITQMAVDGCMVEKDYGELVTLTMTWLGLVLAGAVTQYFQTNLTNLVGQKANLELRNDIYRKMQRLPISYYDRNPVGRLMTRLTNDVEVLNQMFTQGVVFIFGDIFALSGIVIAMLVMDWRLALLAFAALPLLVVASIFFRRVLRVAFRDARTAVSRINSYLQECLGGVHVIKALRREKQNEADFLHLADTHRDAYLRSVRAMGIYYPVVEVIEALAISLLIWYAAGRILEDSLTFGCLVAFIQYTGKFFRPIRSLSEKYNILQDAMASSERIFELLDEVEEEAEPPVGSGATREVLASGDIVFENVHFHYHPEKPVLSDLDIEIPQGRTTAVVGYTGAGKTTLISLLARFYSPTTGRITMGGKDISSYSRLELRRLMAIVQQDVFLFSGTIDDNIRLLEQDIAPERIQEALRVSNADRMVERRGGVSAMVGERGGGYSAGERQLLAFARALAHDPEILILDEATASVDSRTEALIQQALKRLLRGRTSLVIAHRLSTITSADQIIVLHHGKVAELGTHQQLLAQGGLYKDLYRLQFGLADQGGNTPGAG